MFRRGTGLRGSSKPAVLRKHPAAICRRKVSGALQGYEVWVDGHAIASDRRAEDAWDKTAELTRDARHTSFAAIVASVAKNGQKPTVGAPPRLTLAWALSYTSSCPEQPHTIPVQALNPECLFFDADWRGQGQIGGLPKNETADGAHLTPSAVLLFSSCGR